ncbi:unnamed protein product [Closterium sp. NIES-54]
MHKSLFEIGSQQLPHDPGMYRLQFCGDYILLTVYLDDLLYTGTKKNLAMRVNITTNHDVKQFLGLNITYAPEAIHLSAAKYAETLEKRFNISPTPLSTPYRTPGPNYKHDNKTLSHAGLHTYQQQLGPGGGAGRTGAGGTGPRGASAGVPGIGGTRGADTGGTIVLVPGASWRDSLSPQHLREWAARWGSPGGGAGGTGSGGAVATGARGTGYGGVVTTGAGGSRGATTQAQQSALSHLLSFLPAVTEFPFAGTTPPLLFPPPYQSQPQLLSHSPLPAPAPYTAVTESLTESRESVSRPVTPVHTRAVRPRPPPVPCTHIMALRPSSVPQRAILPSPTASSLPHVPDPESEIDPRAPREWHDTVRTTLAALGFAPSTTDPSLFLHTDTSLPPFYVLVYVNDLVFATADTEAQALVKAELQERHTCTDLGEMRSYLGLHITRNRAQCTITLTQSHMVQQVLQRFGFEFSSPQPTPLPTGHSLSTPPSDESVELTGLYPEL